MAEQSHVLLSVMFRMRRNVLMQWAHFLIWCRLLCTQFKTSSYLSLSATKPTIAKQQTFESPDTSQVSIYRSVLIVSIRITNADKFTCLMNRKPLMIATVHTHEECFNWRMVNMHVMKPHTNPVIDGGWSDNIRVRNSCHERRTVSMMTISKFLLVTWLSQR